MGVMLNNLEPDRIKAFQIAVAEGFTIVHANAVPEDFLKGPNRDRYIQAARESGLVIATMFIGFAGQSYADIPSIAKTVGLLPLKDQREHRQQVALAYSSLAQALGVSALGMHLGFFPKDNSHPDYHYLVQAVQSLADHLGQRQQTLHLETGQESADELLEFLHAVDRPNVAINFDPANFLLYGTDHPLRAFDILASHIRGVHCKDGFRPENPGQLGREVPLGQGEVDFPSFLRKLRSLGYQGPLIIERESGPRVKEEIQEGRRYLEKIMAQID